MYFKELHIIKPNQDDEIAKIIAKNENKSSPIIQNRGSSTESDSEDLTSPGDTFGIHEALLTHSSKSGLSNYYN